MSDPAHGQHGSSMWRRLLAAARGVAQSARVGLHGWRSDPAQRLLRLPFIPVLIALLFFGAMFWAKGRDPFKRIWFNIKPRGHARTECVAVLPKTARRPLPVVVYLHGSGGNLLGSGNELRQTAEMGLAALGMEYNQTNAVESDAQFEDLLAWLRCQPWADTNRVAWVGFSLGAQRQLVYAWEHPSSRPQLLVQLSGGWPPRPGSTNAPASPLIPSSQSAQLPGAASRCSVLLLHGERDEDLPPAGAQRLAGWLRTNGLPAEVRIIPGADHGLQPNRLLLCRAIGEYCVSHLCGSDTLAHYRSVLSWQAQAWPLWIFWIPAMVWAALRLYLRRQTGRLARLQPSETSLAAAARASWTRAQVALWSAAGVLAAAAIAETALHLVPPRLPTSRWTLTLARNHIVLRKELADLDYLARDPVWSGKPLKTLLEHVELANYNRQLIDWKLDDEHYRDFVLAPLIDPAQDGNLAWRRALWENFYPRIRKEQTPEAAAPIVARCLRERVTMTSEHETPASGAPAEQSSAAIAQIWQREITNARGFEALYVAALRSVGIPSRLDHRHRAELWTGTAWQLAPRPVFEQWD